MSTAAKIESSILPHPPSRPMSDVCPLSLGQGNREGGLKVSLAAGASVPRGSMVREIIIFGPVEPLETPSVCSSCSHVEKLS